MCRILLNNTLLDLNPKFFLLLDWLPSQGRRAQYAQLFCLELGDEEMDITTKWNANRLIQDLNSVQKEISLWW